MKKDRLTHIMLAVLVACLLASGVADAQTFGRNKVQYRSFDWRIIHTTHFDVYFYDGSEDLADVVSAIVEEANSEFERVLGHELTTVIPVIIYASHNDFTSTNISASHIEETVGGFTELYKNRVVIPFTGSYDDLRHVLYHELTHVFLFDIVYGGLVESVIRQAYTNPVPLWFVEGIAEYMSMGWDPEAEMILRDLAVSDLVVPLEYLYGGYLVYKQGQAVINFIAERYGEEKIREIVRAIAKTHSLERALEETIGLSTVQLSEEFEDAVQERYWPEITERDDREDVVNLITQDGLHWCVRRVDPRWRDPREVRQRREHRRVRGAPRSADGIRVVTGRQRDLLRREGRGARRPPLHRHRETQGRQDLPIRARRRLHPDLVAGR